MLEPAHVGGAALVALAAQPRGVGLGRRDDHAPLPRGHLLVGVEGEGRRGCRARRPRRPRRRPRRAPRRRPRGSPRPRSAASPSSSAHRRRVAEDVDRQQAGRALADRVRGRRRVDVERLRVDVAEDRLGALVEQAVGGGDEAERAGHHLVARAPAERPDAEVERRGPAGDGDGVLDPEPLGEGALEALQHRAQREPPRAQHLERERLLALADLRAGERDLVRSTGAGVPSAAGTRTRATRPAPPRRPR